MTAAVGALCRTVERTFFWGMPMSLVVMMAAGLAALTIAVLACVQIY